MNSNVSTVPVITTARLVLRGHRISDYEDMVAMWGDAAVGHYVLGRPFDRQEVWFKLLQYVGLWHLVGYGYWVAEERRTGRYLVEVGFAQYRREIFSSKNQSPEAGWCFAPYAQGKGFATEAVQAMLAWSDTSLSFGSTVCLIDPDNIASIGVATRCGFNVETRTLHRGKPILLFTRFPAHSSR